MDEVSAGVLFKALAPLFGSIGVVLVVLAKTIDRLLPNPNDKLMRKMAAQTNALHNSHLGDAARDPDGRLKWWFPQGFSAIFEEILDTQKKILEAINNLASKMDTTEMIGDAWMMQAKAMSSIAESVGEHGKGQ